jgi:hypothetical protein
MRRGRLVKVAIVALTLLVGGGSLALAHFDGGTTKDAFKGSGLPPLFSDAQVAIVDAPLKAAETRGHRVAKAWLDSHPLASNAQFAAWAVSALGGPPGASASRKEIAQLKELARQRDAAGDRAATWLESHGKKQPWKMFRKDAMPFVSKGEYGTVKKALDDAMALGSTLQASAKRRYGRPSPYQADPAIHALNQAKFAGQTRQSYPSKHTVLAGAGLAILQRVEPHRVSEYDWMADEIAFSRLYAGGHYLSDLTAGAFLGTLVGDYEARRAGLRS